METFIKILPGPYVWKNHQHHPKSPDFYSTVSMLQSEQPLKQKLIKMNKNEKVDL